MIMNNETKVNNSQLNSYNLSFLINEMKKEEVWNLSGRNAKTLSKNNTMRLVLNTMKAGTEIKRHQAKGPISVLCVEGQIKFNTEESSTILNAGELLLLPEFIFHSVEAIKESGFLLTISQLEN